MGMNRKFNHIVFLVLLLVSTTSLIVGAHYCAGELYSFRLLNDAPGCCSDANCGNCDDNNIILGLSDEYIVGDYQIKYDPLTFISIHSVDCATTYNAFHGSNSWRTIYQLNTPPPGLQKSLSMIQSFIL
jgi:hypothetical protein